MHRTGAWISILVVAVLSLTILSQTCPSEQFSAVFTTSVDLTYDASLGSRPSPLRVYVAF